MSEKITTDAIVSVTAKLQAFAEGLEPDERTVVDALLAAGANEDEVSGFNFTGLERFDLGRATFDAPRFTSMVNSRFCPDAGGGPWTLYMPDSGGGDDGDDEIGRLQGLPRF